MFIIYEHHKKLNTKIVPVIGYAGYNLISKIDILSNLHDFEISKISYAVNIQLKQYKQSECRQ